MSKKKLAGIIGGCIVAVIIIVVIACFQSTPGKSDENNAFSINVTPEQLKGDSIAGQHCVFLVTITNEGQDSQLPVQISAQAPGAQVVIYWQNIVEGQVAEVVVIPAQASIGKTIEVTITGKRGSLTDKKVVGFNVAGGEDDS
mgnify:CR=1 FL=1